MAQLMIAPSGTGECQIEGLAVASGIVTAMLTGGPAGRVYLAQLNLVTLGGRTFEFLIRRPIDLKQVHWSGPPPEAQHGIWNPGHLGGRQPADLSLYRPLCSAARNRYLVARRSNSSPTSPARTAAAIRSRFGRTERRQFAGDARGAGDWRRNHRTVNGLPTTRGEPGAARLPADHRAEHVRRPDRAGRSTQAWLIAEGRRCTGVTTERRRQHLWVPLPTWQPFLYVGSLAAIKFIQENAGGVLNVSYY